MFLGFGILGASFVAAVWTVLVRHAGWNRAVASLAAFAICPLLFLIYASSMEDSVTGGLALMIGLPVTIIAGLAGLALAAIGELLFGIGGGGGGDPGSDEN